jgi:hypothetical protein
MNPTATYCASQIAAALGRSKRGVCKALRSATPASFIGLRGQMADGWRLDQLPASYRVELAEIAAARGLRNAEHLLSSPAERWQPRRNGEPVKMGEISQGASMPL